MSSKRSKGTDEMFCRSCGDAIKKKAEICPNCGVRNQKAENTKPSSSSTATSTTHDPTRYETTVSDSWWYGIAGGTIAWVFLLLVASVAGSGLGAAGGLLTLVAWIGMPVAAYFDMQYIRANGKWNPNTVVWVALMAVWVVNIIAGSVYLYRRHEVLGEP